jgi:hypothetical protein
MGTMEVIAESIEECIEGKQKKGKQPRNQMILNSSSSKNTSKTMHNINREKGKMMEMKAIKNLPPTKNYYETLEEEESDDEEDEEDNAEDTSMAWAAEEGNKEEMVELTPHYINLLTNPIVMVSGRPDTFPEQLEGSESGAEEEEMEKDPKSIPRAVKGDTVVTTEGTIQVSMRSTEEYRGMANTSSNTGTKETSTKAITKPNCPSNKDLIRKTGWC